MKIHPGTSQHPSLWVYLLSLNDKQRKEDVCLLAALSSSEAHV